MPRRVSILAFENPRDRAISGQDVRRAGLLCLHGARATTVSDARGPPLASLRSSRAAVNVDETGQFRRIDGGRETSPSRLNHPTDASPCGDLADDDLAREASRLKTRNSQGDIAVIHSRSIPPNGLQLCD